MWCTHVTYISNVFLEPNKRQYVAIAKADLQPGCRHQTQMLSLANQNHRKPATGDPLRRNKMGLTRRSCAKLLVTHVSGSVMVSTKTFFLYLNNL